MSELQRKTLCFKGKSTASMWSAPSYSENLEHNLSETVKRILQEWQNTPTHVYSERFRITDHAVNKLTECLVNSYEELLKELEKNLQSPKLIQKYPNLSLNLFKQMTSAVQNKLDKLGAQMFNEALNNYWNAKAQLPKIVDGNEPDRSAKIFARPLR